MMKHVDWLQVFLSLVLSIHFCPVAWAQATNPAPANAADLLSPCPKFEDAQNRDETEVDYVIYKDFLRAKQWDQAFPYWQKVYAEAPAADGRRATVYLDGIRIYEHFYRISQDSFEKDSYIDRIFELYDDMQACYPGVENTPARKALDLYYKYPHRATKEEIFLLCKEALDAEPEKVPASLMLPITKLLKELYQNEQLTGGEVRGCIESLSKICSHNKKHCHGQRECQYWSQIESMVMGQIEFFETIRGFFSCEYYLEKYNHLFEGDFNNCEITKRLLIKLKLADCDQTLEIMQKLSSAEERYCMLTIEPKPASPREISIAFKRLIEGDYTEAEQLFYEEASEIGRENPRVSSLFLIAKICYSHLKRFNKAREYAKKAAALKKDWGEPYILLGRIYAASDALCKGDTDRLYIPWLAMDQWHYAKKIDPSITSEANKWIDKYKNQLPTIEMVNKYGLVAGDTVHIGCWIQENTQVRVEQ